MFKRLINLVGLIKCACGKHVSHRYWSRQRAWGRIAYFQCSRCGLRWRDDVVLPATPAQEESEEHNDGC